MRRFRSEFKGITDHDYLSRRTKASLAFALGYYLTGDERYAGHAALLMRNWFLAPATAMHPNLNFAQFKSGLDTGKGMGIPELRSLPQAIDAVDKLAGS